MPTEHQVLSSIGPRAVRPLKMTAEDTAEYAGLSQIGINVDDRSVRMLMSAMDAFQGTVSTASIATPVQFLQNWLPGFVAVLTAARKIDELIGVDTVGNWHDEEIVQGVLENTGAAQPYSDYSNVPLASWNPNFERRTVVRFEQGARVGVLEEARAATIRVNSGEAKRNSAALALEIRRNLVGFNGFNSGDNRTYGFLNDPSLPAYVSATTGASSYTTWSTKTFLEIQADIIQMLKGIRVASQDQIDPHATPITLALATNVVDYLSVNNALGTQSLMQWLKETYPNIRVVSAPQLNIANGGANVGYAYAETVSDGYSTDGGKTWAQIVPSKNFLLGVQKLAKGYEEDYSNATAGALLKRPYAVYRITGI